MSEPLAPARVDLAAIPPVRIPGAVAWAVVVALTSVAVPAALTALRREGPAPLAAMAASVPEMVTLATATLALLVLVDLLDRTRRLSAEASRKVAHVGAGLVACAAPFLFTTHWPMLLLVSMFTALLVTSGRLGVLAPLHPAERRGRGDLVYPLGLYAAFLLTNGDAFNYLVAVLILALADPAAALAGGPARSLRFVVAGTERSVRGSAAFAMTALLIAAPLLAAAGRMGGANAFAVAVAVAVVAALAEAVSPPGVDNVSIPVAVALAVATWT